MAPLNATCGTSWPNPGGSALIGRTCGCLCGESTSQVIIKQLDRGELTCRTKHLRLAFNAVKDRVADGNIELNHVEGKENPADLFTKPLPLEDFTRHTDFLLNDKGTQLAEWQSCMIDEIMKEWHD